MYGQTLFALGLTLVSACLVNWGYLTEHSAASKLPPLSPREPLRSLKLLLGNRRWVLGFSSETAGFVLYVAAVALAPLALVQAVAAGGIGVLAFLVAQTTGARLSGREWFGVLVAIGGLALLGISLAGGTEHGTSAEWILVVMWLGASAGAAAIAIGLAKTVLQGGVGFGIAAGILFGAGDVSTKVMVGEGSEHFIVVPAVIAFYGAGTIVLQIGFQRGSALTTAGIATLGTNAIPIAAAMTIFAEPLPGGLLGALRIAAFAAVVAGAVALSPRHSTSERSAESTADHASPGPLARPAG